MGHRGVWNLREKESEGLEQEEKRKGERKVRERGMCRHIITWSRPHGSLRLLVCSV